jgi:uncharacterized membrane protein YeaQ/YmgE (transglycosylase-associated protein family)
MSILEFLLLLLIAGICGAIARAMVGYTHGGCVVSVALGFIGALLGSWLATQFKLPEILPITVGDKTFPIIWSIIGASLFSAVLNLLTRRRPPVS